MEDEDDYDDDVVEEGIGDKERIVEVRLSTVSPVDLYPSTLGIT